MSLHQYAGDSQIYVSSPVDQASLLIDRFAAFLYDVDNWLKASRLRLNASNTQVIWLGSSQQLQPLNIPHVNILSTCVDVADTARDLGVIIDSHHSQLKLLR